tara:strand:+ start:3483 stop:4367 length:885 start_codon:yes stop_codon:yes gene_type:complete
MATPQLLLQVDAILKTVTYKGVTKTIADGYWTSDIVPAIYPLWDSDKDKLVMFAWYDNSTYLAQKRKYTKNFKTGAFYWNDYEMEDVGGNEGETLFNAFKDAFFLADSLDKIEYETEFAKLHAQTSTVSWLSVRLARNFLLTETDYVFIEDSPVSAEDKILYKTYRQKLRDVPSDTATTDPSAVKFPINPSYFKKIWLEKDPTATYLGTADQFVTLASHYFTTFQEKFAAYLVVKDLTEGLYNKSFIDELKTAGVVYDGNNGNIIRQMDDFSIEQRQTTEDYLNALLKKIEDNQ